ncbi:MAG: type III-A CRISPR-associated protein Csm2 [Syntrophobacteraceae bacterium]|jgi:CRISPR-associated protein Csm2
MMEFYKDIATRSIRPELFSKDVEQLAITLSKEVGSNKGTQIRRFYNEVVRLNALAKASADDWDNVLPYVHMLVAKSAYAEGRKLVTETFVKFIKESIGQIKSKEDLDVFANAFESFVGFYKKYREKDD